MSATDLSADVGLVAVGVITANLLVGLLIAMRYSPWRCWPHKKFDTFRLHRWTGYAALALIIVHPIPLLFATPRFRLLDIVYPLHSPVQPLENTIGAIALYGVAIVVITSYFRLWLGRRLWKGFHFVIYAAALALFWHGIFTDSSLKHVPLDPFDGEKVFIEACGILTIAAATLRWRYDLRQARLSRTAIAMLPGKDS